MGMINVSEVQDKHFGRCVKMENGRAELLVTLDFGPRIIHYALVGHENMMYQDATHKPLGEAFPVYGGDICKLYGGHRLWISPEILPRCYHPDNGPVEYEETPEGVNFTASIEKFSRVQKSMMISMSNTGSDVKILHKITNHSLWELEIAPWAITMLAAGGVAAIPVFGPATGVLPNRRLALWDYTNIADPRLTMGRDYVLIQQSQDARGAFKMGLFNHSGFGAYFNRGQAFFKYFDVIDGLFTDFGCNYEVYTNENFMESESLGPLQMLATGQSVLHTEIWQLFEEDSLPLTEAEAAEIIRKYVKDENC
jgi:hypothetical protein